jgi:hypothetical protein
MVSLEQYLKEAGFTDVELVIKEESREIISQWLPGSGAEEFVVGAEVKARKLLMYGFMQKGLTPVSENCSMNDGMLRLDTICPRK